MRLIGLRRAAGPRWPLLAAVIVVPIAAVAWILWTATGAVDEARLSTAAAFDTVSIRSLDPVLAPARHEIGAPSDFSGVARYDDRLFAAGAHGLVEYDDRGQPLRRFRTGFELPPTRIVDLTVGTLASSAWPELVMATESDGLIAFDGTRLRHIRPETPGYGRITATLWLGAGRLLLGTERHGVLVYDGDRQLALAHPSLADIPVTSLAGADGDVWIGTLDRGVLHWRGASFDRIDEAGGLPDRRVLGLAVAGNRAYVATAVGVAEFTDGRFTRTLGDGLFATAVVVRDDTLIVGTLDGTVARIPLAVRASRGARVMAQPAPGAIHRLVPSGDALYAVTPDGVYVVDAAAGFHLAVDREPGQLSDRNVSALALDRLGRLWVGYFDRGLDVLSAEGDRLVHVENDYVFCVNRIVHDADSDTTAVATANGLVLFDAAGRERQRLGRPDGLIASHVTDLVLRRGGMTLATPAGITFLDEDGPRSLSAFHGLVSNQVYALAATGDQLVAGTLGGISVLDGNAVHTSYTIANSGLTHNWITALVRVGDEWFAGTYGGSVVRLDAEGRPSPFDDLPHPTEINPNAMAVTATHVFAGTLTRGLLVYDRASGRWSTFDTGLPSVNITALATGPEDLYIGTDNGILRIAYAGLDRP